MIQFNLLPDVKLEYIKAQRTRRLVLTIAILVTAASVTLLAVLFLVGQFENKHSNDLSKAIKVNSKKLQSEPQIDRVLTVQNQLESLTGLHEQKPAVDRLFGYLNDITPAVVSINSVTLDTVNHTIEITGTADKLSSVNQYVDTLKFTKYKLDGKDTGDYAFTGTVLSNFSVTAGAQNSTTGNNAPSSTDYTIDATYNEDLFDITKDASLSVPPNKITTRSQVDKPTDLFTGQPKTDSVTEPNSNKVNFTTTSGSAGQ